MEIIYKTAKLFLPEFIGFLWFFLHVLCYLDLKAIVGKHL